MVKEFVNARMRKLIAAIEAIAKGLDDGFRQPYEVGSSWNLDHLWVHLKEPYNLHDLWMSIGQFLRAGIHSEAWREGYLPGQRPTREE